MTRGSDWRVVSGDCLEEMAQLDDASVDAIVTDPPYAIGRLAQERWDEQGIREAAARVGHERLSASESFQVWCRGWARECHRVLRPGGHLLAFGAPRTAHRLTAGIEDAGFEVRDVLLWLYGTGMPKSGRLPGGRGTTLKPAYEPVLLARRPPEGPVARNIERFGTGALEIDACRVEGRRHPANVLSSHGAGCREGSCEGDCPAALIDRAACRSRSRSDSPTQVSRLFYSPKAGRKERDAGCEHLPRRVLDLFPNADRKPKRGSGAHNPHPTLKPLGLMRWLVRLSCPPGGLVLDPFCGSGTTGAAAALEDRSFIGIELEDGYADIAAARIAHWAPGNAKVGRGPLGSKA